MRKFEDFCDSSLVQRARSNDPSLTLLNLRGGRPVQNMNDDDLEVLIQELKTNSNITNLILAENSITSQGLKEIHLLKSITILDLTDNLLDDSAIDFLSKMTQVKELILRSNMISGKNFGKLFANLKNLQALTLNDEFLAPQIEDKIPANLKLTINSEEIRNKVEFYDFDFNLGERREYQCRCFF